MRGTYIPDSWTSATRAWSCRHSPPPALTQATAAILLVLIASSSALAQIAEDRGTPDSPFTRSAIARAVAEQRSTASTPPSEAQAWLHLTKLTSGSDVHVRVRDRGTLERRLVRADAGHLALLDLHALTKDLGEACLRLIRDNLNLFEEISNGRSFVRHGIHIGPEGIRDGAGTTRASIDDVFERVPRDSVLEVSIPADSPRQTWGRLGLVLIATSTVVSAVESRRRCGCSEMGLTLPGAALFGGGLFAMATSSQYPKVARGTRTVIFKKV